MVYSVLGTSGLRVSKLAIGTALFGVAPTEPEAHQLINGALDAGINFIDTANTYGNQARFDRPGIPEWRERRSAEEIVGEAIEGRRHEVILATKVSESIGDGPNDGGPQGGGLSRAHIMRCIGTSLKRLGTDYIDIYHAHHPDPLTSIEETLLAFSDLIRQGMIHYYGLSTFDGWQVTEAIATADRLGIPRPVCHQTRYNLAKRWVESEVLPATRAAGLGVTAFSPLAGGLLSGRAHNENTGDVRWGGQSFTKSELKLAAQYQTMADRWSLPPSHVAIAWLLSRPGIASVIIGPENIEQLHDLIPATAVTLSLDQSAEIESLLPGPINLWNQ